jgi:hypothetical protein
MISEKELHIAYDAYCDYVETRHVSNEKYDEPRWYALKAAVEAVLHYREHMKSLQRKS